MSISRDQATEFRDMPPAGLTRALQRPTWATEGRSTEDCHGHPALLAPPQIGEGATDEGHGRREGNAVDEATDEERADVLGHGARDDEDDCES